jgi:ubiquinone/menaquinone biosynthesis C-methylase UbiE
MLPTEDISFPTRPSRTAFIAQRFARYLQPSVLDVGCYEAPLRQMLPKGTSYIGVDFAGNPDIELNLEAIQRLPFENDSFECVICIEVLEHLDNLHDLFDELVRVSNKYTIVSLPNCWRDARRPVERGRGNFAHYGLPLEKPIDRHKWFFNITAAREFLIGKASKHGLDVVEMFVTEKPKSIITKALRKLRFQGESYQNRYAGSVWVVLKKFEHTTQL